MIKSISATNPQGETVKMELRSPEKSGFLVQNILGLTPPRAIVNTTEIASSDGVLFNSARLSSRNIVLTLVLMPKPTLEDTRRASYRYFPIKKRVDLEIETDARTYSTYGYVESNDAFIFSKQVISTISIICPDSYFQSVNSQDTVLSGVEATFTFPFSNESLDDPKLEFGSIVIATEKQVYNAGDSETGVTIFAHFLGPVENLLLYNNTSGQTFGIISEMLEILLGVGLTTGDDLFISTVKGNKFAYLLRDGNYYNIINTLAFDSHWLILERGDNIIGFIADSGSENVQLRIRHKTLYEGI